MTDREQLCREFTELTGGHWHEGNIYLDPKTNYRSFGCKLCGSINPNPTYDHSDDVLKVMIGLGLCEEFLISLRQPPYYIAVDFIVLPDAMLKAAVTFLKERKK